MARAKTFQRGPFQADAQTMSEARAAVDAQIDAALSADYTPVVAVTPKGAMFVAWREPSGWCYRTPSGAVVMLNHNGDRDYVSRSVHGHAAQWDEV